LFEGGALDVSIQHLQMKKNRPGFLVRVLARPSDRLPLVRLLFAESTAIGVRACELDRVVLDREVRRVATPYGRVAVKIAWDADGRALVSAEYDDCKRAARRSGAPGSIACMKSVPASNSWRTMPCWDPMIFSISTRRPTRRPPPRCR